MTENPSVQHLRPVPNPPLCTCDACTGTDDVDLAVAFVQDVYNAAEDVWCTVEVSATAGLLHGPVVRLLGHDFTVAQAFQLSDAINRMAQILIGTPEEVRP